jgi:hypothetical protein
MSNEKIDKLTPEQEKMLPVYEKRYLEIGLSTEPCDRVKAEEALRESYDYLKLPQPKKIVWVDSPFVGAKLAAALAEGKKTQLLMDVAPELAVDPNCNPWNGPIETLTIDEVRRQGDTASYGSFDAYWVSFYSFIAEQLPVKKDKLIEIVNKIIRDCGVYWTFDEVIIVSEKPKAIHLKDKKLHSLDGLALEYRDGSGLYAVNGSIKKSLMEVILAANYEENDKSEVEF